jgi:hypothetical protein
MPRLSDDLLASVFRIEVVDLERTDDDPESWEGVATGFLLSFPYVCPELTNIGGSFKHVYAVTNSHVLPPEGHQGPSKVTASFLTMLSTDGGVAPDPDRNSIELPSASWVRLPEDDLAVFDLTAVFGSAAPQWAFNVGSDHERWHGNDDVMSLQEAYDRRIGEGDELMFAGHFHGFPWGAADQNVPTVRFGNIACMNPPPYEDPEFGFRKQECILGEMRSFPGYSGSPVLAYTMPGQRHYLFKDGKRHVQGNPGTRRYDLEPVLIGIDMAHLPVEARLLREGEPEDVTIEAHSGMSVIIPIWRLIAFLEQTEFQEVRKVGMARRIEEVHSSGQK